MFNFYHPNLHEATETFAAFVDAIRTENGHRIFSPEAEGDELAILDDDCITKLLDSNVTNYYAAENADAACRINFIAGIASGAALTASIFGITSLVRRCRNQRRNGNK